MPVNHRLVFYFPSDHQEGENIIWGFNHTSSYSLKIHMERSYLIILYCSSEENGISMTTVASFIYEVNNGRYVHTQTILGENVFKLPASVAILSNFY